jgi:hypothetical protein
MLQQCESCGESFPISEILLVESKCLCARCAFAADSSERRISSDHSVIKGRVILRTLLDVRDIWSGKGIA